MFDIDTDFDLAMFVELARNVARMNDPVIIHHPQAAKEAIEKLIANLGHACPEIAGRQFPCFTNPYLPDAHHVYFYDRGQISPKFPWGPITWQ